MLYPKELLVPAKTPETSPVSVEIEIAEPLISRIEVFFPPGCAALVKVRLMRGTEQVWPRPHGSWASGNNEVVGSAELLKVPMTPIVLRFEGCSPEANFDHRVLCRIHTLPEEVVRYYESIERIREELEWLITTF